MKLRLSTLLLVVWMSVFTAIAKAEVSKVPPVTSPPGGIGQTGQLRRWETPQWKFWFVDGVIGQPIDLTARNAEKAIEGGLEFCNGAKCLCPLNAATGIRPKVSKNQTPGKRACLSDLCYVKPPKPQSFTVNNVGWCEWKGSGPSRQCEETTKSFVVNFPANTVCGSSVDGKCGNKTVYYNFRSYTDCRVRQGECQGAYGLLVDDEIVRPGPPPPLPHSVVLNCSGLDKGADGWSWLHQGMNPNECLDGNGKCANPCQWDYKDATNGCKSSTVNGQCAKPLANVLLPPQLTSATNGATGGSLVGWMTPEQEPFDGFILQRASDGVNFVTIAQIPDSNITSFIDASGRCNDSYRAQTFVQDGSTETSPLSNVMQVYCAPIVTPMPTLPPPIPSPSPSPNPITTYTCTYMAYYVIGESINVQVQVFGSGGSIGSYAGQINGQTFNNTNSNVWLIPTAAGPYQISSATITTEGGQTVTCSGPSSINVPPPLGSLP